MCGWTRRGEIRAFVSGELAGWIEETRTWQHAVKRKSHSPNCARILGVLYIVEPLCSTLQEAEAIHVGRRAPISTNFKSVP